jgi:O-methyltransferase
MDKEIRDNSTIAKFPKFLQSTLILLRFLFKDIISKQTFNPNKWHYRSDGVATFNNIEFLSDPEFTKSYNALIEAYGWNPGLYWRVHHFIWAVNMTRNLPGNWVECGVGRGGLMSSALESFPEWASSGKRLFLFDTFLPYFTGDDGSQKSTNGVNELYYAIDEKSVRKNFSKWVNIEFCVGNVFDTINPNMISKVNEISILSIDLNHADPEEYVFRNFWPLVIKGGIVILDDYLAINREKQKLRMDNLSKELNFSILSCPSGQGIIVKNY